MTGSNRRPSACKADALPAELITLRFGVGASYTNNPQCLDLNAIYLKYFLYPPQKLWNCPTADGRRALNTWVVNPIGGRVRHAAWPLVVNIGKLFSFTTSQQSST